MVAGVGGQCLFRPGVFWDGFLRRSDSGRPPERGNLAAYLQLGPLPSFAVAETEQELLIGGCERESRDAQKTLRAVKTRSTWAGQVLGQHCTSNALSTLLPKPRSHKWARHRLSCEWAMALRSWKASRPPPRMVTA